MTLLWEKGTPVDRAVPEFTVGDDRVLDARLAHWDALGTLAHVEALARVGLLLDGERHTLRAGLRARALIIRSAWMVASRPTSNSPSPSGLRLLRLGDREPELDGVLGHPLRLGEVVALGDATG